MALSPSRNPSASNPLHGTHNSAEPRAGISRNLRTGHSSPEPSVNASAEREISFLYAPRRIACPAADEYVGNPIRDKAPKVLRRRCAPGAKSPFAEITDDDIDNLFSA